MTAASSSRLRTTPRHRGLATGLMVVLVLARGVAGVCAVECLAHDAYERPAGRSGGAAAKALEPPTTVESPAAASDLPPCHGRAADEDARVPSGDPAPSDCTHAAPGDVVGLPRVAVQPIHLPGAGAPALLPTVAPMPFPAPTPAILLQRIRARGVARPGAHQVLRV
ncbi:MAG: hypothetical protein U0Q12_09610 [Vicinamibacterales bacterium]